MWLLLLRRQQKMFLEYGVCFGSPLCPESGAAADLAVRTESIESIWISIEMKWILSSATL